MSGGHFEYKQYHIKEIADSIEQELKNQGKKKYKDELWNNDEFYEKYPEEKFYITYPKEIQKRLKEAVKALRIAEIYAQRVDWFLSGDDGDESFLNNLSKDLGKLKIK